MVMLQDVLRDQDLVDLVGVACDGMDVHGHGIGPITLALAALSLDWALVNDSSASTARLWLIRVQPLLQNSGLARLSQPENDERIDA